MVARVLLAQSYLFETVKYLYLNLILYVLGVRLILLQKKRANDSKNNHTDETPCVYATKRRLWKIGCSTPAFLVLHYKTRNILTIIHATSYVKSVLNLRISLR